MVRVRFCVLVIAIFYVKYHVSLCLSVGGLGRGDQSLFCLKS